MTQTKAQLRQIVRRRVALFCGVLAIQLLAVGVIARYVPSDAGFFAVCFLFASSVFAHPFAQMIVFGFWQEYTTAEDDPPAPAKEPPKPGTWKE
jgi:hypothetical protein